MIEFEWDERKNEENRKKHGVWFEEAKQAFDDPNAIVFFDYENSSLKERRFILLGDCGRERIFVVVHCELENTEKIRIISAREATKKEIRKYEEGI